MQLTENKSSSYFNQYIFPLVQFIELLPTPLVKRIKVTDTTVSLLEIPAYHQSEGL